MNKLSSIPDIQKRLSRARTVGEAKAIQEPHGVYLDLRCS